VLFDSVPPPGPRPKEEPGGRRLGRGDRQDARQPGKEARQHSGKAGVSHGYARPTPNLTVPA